MDNAHFAGQRVQVEIARAAGVVVGHDVGEEVQRHAIGPRLQIHVLEQAEGCGRATLEDLHRLVPFGDEPGPFRFRQLVLAHHAHFGPVEVAARSRL